jgi:NADH-quinone oxidoreductase chain G
MVRVFINNESVIVPNHSSVLEACRSIGIEIPRFCYHERLNVSGNCRFCLVEIDLVDKPNPAKPIASCTFPVDPEMEIYTDGPMVQKARENILEFLLINHPLDCPICDQGGECDLQEQTLAFGSDRSRFFFLKRAIQDKSCGPLVKTIMTRCIQCTRCVRFLDKYMGKHSFGLNLRGSHMEIGSYLLKPFYFELIGNIVDICPVGALTSKPYSFITRPWELNSFESIDMLDSFGSNIKINYKKNKILRILPVLNDELNEEWITDKARYSIDSLKTNRLLYILYLSNSKYYKTTLKKAYDLFLKKIQNLLIFKSETVLFYISSSLDFFMLKKIRRISFFLDIPLISENFKNDDNDLMIFNKMNTKFSELLNSDFCLLLGSNVRFEASLLNIRLKKRKNEGRFSLFSLGLTENCLFDINSIGSNFSSFINILEGKHYLCSKLLTSKLPSIIIGNSFKKRFDISSLYKTLFHLSSNVSLISSEHFGINFLPLEISNFSETFLNIPKKKFLSLKKKRFIYALNLNNYKNIFKQVEKNKNYKTVVVQTAFGNPILNNIDLLLPSPTFFDTENVFINMEGRIQKTQKLPFSENSKHIFEYLKTNDSTNSSISSITHYNHNNLNFLKSFYFLTFLTYSKLWKSFIKPSFVNYFTSNSFLKNSLTLTKCALIFSQKYENFI